MSPPPPFLQKLDDCGFEVVPHPTSGTQTELCHLRAEMKGWDEEFRSISSVTASTCKFPSVVLTRLDGFSRDIAEATTKITEWKEVVAMPPPPKREPSARQLQVMQLRQEFAEAKQQLRRLKEMKDNELLYRDSLQDHQEEEIDRLRRENRNLSVRLCGMFSSHCF